MYNATQKVISLSGGREIIIETGKLAKQADGSVVVKQGNTMLLATVTAAKEAKDDCDFMPLSVEYKEKYASCGRFPGGFLKREGRASDYEILVSRLIDRALRPLACRMFPLTPVLSVRDGRERLSVRMDPRAFAVCPLCEGGVRGMDAAFAQAVLQLSLIHISEPTRP